MNRYIENIRPYQAVAHDIWKMNGGDLSECLKLDWNEATIPPSPKVREKIAELAGNPYFFQWYPDTGNQELLKMISDYVGVEKGNVQVFPSSDALHEYIAKTWLLPEDEVLIMWPTYDNFRVAVESVGAKVLYCEMEDFSFDMNKMSFLIQCNKPKMVYICNPNNPTGEGIEVDDLKRMVRDNQVCLFVLDEAYVEYYGKSLVSEVPKCGNLLITRTFSKAFGLANFRIGYLVSSERNIEAVSRIRNGKSISTFAQEAAMAALDDLPYMQGYVREVIAARQMFVEQIGKMGMNIRIYPSEANFVLVVFADISTKDRFADFLKKNKIYVRKLSQSDNLLNSVRVTIGTVEQMRFVLKKIEEFKRHYENSIV